MKRVFGAGGVVLAGIATSAATAIAVTIISAATDYDLLSLMANVFPVGAMVCGAVAASGYYFGAKWLQSPPTKGLALQMMMVAACTQLLIYVLEYQVAEADGVRAANVLSFGEYLDLTLTRGHVLLSDRGREVDMGAAGSDGYFYAGLELIGLIVGGCWVFFALLRQPTCPVCEKYLRTLATKDDVFRDDESFFAYYNGEFDHPVDSLEFARHVGTRHRAFGGRIAIHTSVQACPTCGTQSVDETVRVFQGDNWVEAENLSRVVDIPPSVNVAAAYKGAR